MNKISCFVFLLVVIVSIFLKFYNIELNKFFSIIFIFGIILILLYTVNDFISSVITNIKDIKDIKDIDKIKERDDNAKKIGFIERILFFIGIVSQNWALISIVIVLKSIARYKEIDNQIKAEYFLIGSLLSLLCAIIISVIFIAFDKIHNLGIINYIVSLVSYNLNIIN